MHSLYDFAEKELGAPFHGTLEEAVQALEQIGWQVQLKGNGYAASKSDGVIPENFMSTLGALNQDGTINHDKAFELAKRSSQNGETMTLESEPVVQNQQYVSPIIDTAPPMPTQVSGNQVSRHNTSRRTITNKTGSRDYSAFGNWIMGLPKAVQVILQFLLIGAILVSLSLPLEPYQVGLLLAFLIFGPIGLMYSWKKPTAAGSSTGVTQEVHNPIVR